MTIVLSTLALLLPGPVDPPVNVEVKRGHVRCNQACKTKRYKRKVVKPYRWKLNRMAWCESRDRWHIATGNGYYGGLQFDLRTWWSVGGRAYPHWASELEQKYRAVKLIWRRGYAPWPICGYI